MSDLPSSDRLYTLGLFSPRRAAALPKGGKTVRQARRQSPMVQDCLQLTQSQSIMRSMLLKTLALDLGVVESAARLPNRQKAIFALDALIENAMRLQDVLMDRSVQGIDTGAGRPKRT